LKRFLAFFLTGCLLLFLISGCTPESAYAPGSNLLEDSKLEDVVAQPDLSEPPAPDTFDSDAPEAPVPGPVPDNSQPEEPFVYVALGDSIARGYGLSSVETQRYSSLLADRISQEWDVSCTCYNYAVDGQRSEELVAWIQAGNTPELSNADLVTISIGANNVLQPAISFLTTYFSYMLSNGLTEAAAEELYRSFNAFLAAADHGIKQLESDIPVLIALIRSINPDAQIVFQTVYNPYRNSQTILQIPGLPIVMEALSQTQIEPLNRLIADNAAANGYTVADVWSAFQTDDRILVNAGQDSTIGNIDPHPTAIGHEQIAETIFRTLTRP